MLNNRVGMLRFLIEQLNTKYYKVNNIVRLKEAKRYICINGQDENM